MQGNAHKLIQEAQGQAVCEPQWHNVSFFVGRRSTLFANTNRGRMKEITSKPFHQLVSELSKKGRTAACLAKAHVELRITTAILGLRRAP